MRVVGGELQRTIVAEHYGVRVHAKVERAFDAVADLDSAAGYDHSHVLTVLDGQDLLNGSEDDCAVRTSEKRNEALLLLLLLF